jgi:hypothetical protein
MSQLDDLHDATLTQIRLDWAIGDFSADFVIVGHRRLQIIGKGVKSFSYGREFPWGPSISVNKCRIETKNAEAVLTIEMQSGDELIGKADDFLVSP